MTTPDQPVPGRKDPWCRFCTTTIEPDKEAAAAWLALKSRPDTPPVPLCDRCQRCPACSAKASDFSAFKPPIPPNDSWYIRMRCPENHRWALEREASSVIPKVITGKVVLNPAFDPEYENKNLYPAKAQRDLEKLVNATEKVGGLDVKAGVGVSRAEIVRRITESLTGVAEAAGDTSQAVRKYSDAARPLEDVLKAEEPRTGTRFVEGAEMVCRACGISGTDYTPLGLSESVCRACLVCPSCGRADGLKQDLNEENTDWDYIVRCTACEIFYSDGIIGERLQRRREMAEAPPIKAGRFRYLED